MMMNMKLCTNGILTLLAAGYSGHGKLPAPQPNDVPVTQTEVVEVPAVVAPANPIVEIAICLDTSGSMSGLIDSARQKLWGIVNEFVFADPQPKLRVALLTFGNDGHSQENGWVKLETGLTEDLDLVSRVLFEQTTNGGTELVGRVVSSATRQLTWSTEPGALKLIIVAGNESADQDHLMTYGDAARAAIAADIMVNAIYCGGLADPDALAWQHVARLADGQFAAIDHNSGTVVMETPFDVELTAMSAGLNKTYLAFGATGEWNRLNQVAQDGNAVGLNGEAAASRAFCKANGLYNCASWDLVDALQAGNVVLAALKDEELPESMRAMNLLERQTHVDSMKSKRTEIQQQVNDLTAKRQAYVDEEMLKQSLDSSKSFDNAIRTAVRSQAEAKGYRFKAPTPVVPVTPAVRAEELNAPKTQTVPQASPAPATAPVMEGC